MKVHVNSNPLLLLTIILVILKLSKIIDWDWFYVFSPILLILVFVAIGVIAAIISTIVRITK